MSRREDLVPVGRSKPPEAAIDIWRRLQELRAKHRRVASPHRMGLPYPKVWIPNAALPDQETRREPISAALRDFIWDRDQGR